MQNIIKYKNIKEVSLNRYRIFISIRFQFNRFKLKSIKFIQLLE